MTDEEAMFEAWCPLAEARMWEDMFGFTSAPPGWKEEMKRAMREGWLARASLHCSQSARGAKELNNGSNVCPVGS